MAADLATESKIESLSLVSNDPSSTYAPKLTQLAEGQRAKLWISFELIQHVSSFYPKDELIASVLAELSDSPEHTSEDWQEHHLIDYFTELYLKDRIDILATWIHLMHEQGVPVTFTELANICAKIFAAAPAKVGFVDGIGFLDQSPLLQEKMNRLTESIRMVYEWGVEHFGDAAVPYRGKPFTGSSQRFTFTREAIAAAEHGPSPGKRPRSEMMRIRKKKAARRWRAQRSDEQIECQRAYRRKYNQSDAQKERRRAYSRKHYHAKAARLREAKALSAQAGQVGTSIVID